MLQETLTHQQRIDVIHLSLNHGISYRTISEYRKIPFSTVRLIVQEFKKTQRSNKLHTFSMKQKLLRDQEKHQMVHKLRREAIQQRRNKRLNINRKRSNRQNRNLIVNLDHIFSGSIKSENSLRDASIQQQISADGSFQAIRSTNECDLRSAK